MDKICWLAARVYAEVDCCEPSIQRSFAVEGEEIRFIFHGLDAETVLTMVIAYTSDISYFAQDDDVYNLGVL